MATQIALWSIVINLNLQRWINSTLGGWEETGVTDRMTMVVLRHFVTKTYTFPHTVLFTRTYKLR